MIVNIFDCQFIPPIYNIDTRIVSSTGSGTIAPYYVKLWQAMASKMACMTL